MRKRRGGFTLTETFVAGIVLATALAVATQMMVAAARQRKAFDMRQLASIEAGNVMERLAAEPWSKLESAAVDTWELGVQAASTLPNARLDIQIEPIASELDAGEAGTGELAGKRITVDVSYGGTGEQPNQPVRLVAWRYEHSPFDTESEENKEP